MTHEAQMTDLREKVARGLLDYDYQWNTTHSAKEKQAFQEQHWSAYAARADAVLSIIKECAKEEVAQLVANLRSPYIRRQWIEKAADQLTALLARLAEVEKALERIAQHPIETPIGGRPSLGIEGWPSCQAIARDAING